METAANRCCSAVGMHGARSASCGRRAAKGRVLSLAEGKETLELGEACEKRAGRGEDWAAGADCGASVPPPRHTMHETRHKAHEASWARYLHHLPPAMGRGSCGGAAGGVTGARQLQHHHMTLFLRTCAASACHLARSIRNTQPPGRESAAAWPRARVCDGRQRIRWQRRRKEAGGASAG